MAANTLSFKLGTSKRRGFTFATMNRPIVRLDWPRASFGQLERFASLLQRISPRRQILNIEACFPDSVIGLVADQRRADTRFVKYLFDAVLKVRFQSFTQGAAQDNLSQAKLLSIKFPVPDLAVQKKIADTLSAYDDLIENNRRRIALLEEAARLLYREWFVHFRFPRPRTRQGNRRPAGGVGAANIR